MRLFLGLVFGFSGWLMGVWGFFLDDDDVVLVFDAETQKLSRITCFMEKKILLGGAAGVHD